MCTSWDLLASCEASSLSAQLPPAWLIPFLSGGFMDPIFPSASGFLLCITFCSSGLPRIDWIPPLDRHRTIKCIILKLWYTYKLDAESRELSDLEVQM